MSKAGWQAKRFDEFCTLQRGFDLPTQDRKAGKFPLVSSSGISDSHDEAPVLAPGVVTGRSGSIGNVFYIEDNFWPLNTTLYIRDFHGNSPRFVYYLLIAFDLKKYAGGTGVPTLNRNDVHSVQILVPNTLKEQNRIVAILDAAFDHIATARANCEANLLNARAIFESHLQKVFAKAWGVGNLVTLADLATDVTDGDHMPPPKAETGIAFITIGNIDKSTRTIDFSDTFKVPKIYFDGLKPNKKPKKGDVLYTVTGSFGIPVLITENRDFCFQRHVGLVRPKADVNSEWLYYLLMSPQVVKQANDGATGTAQKTVSLKLMRGFEVPRVPLVNQQAVVSKLNAVFEETQRLESLYQRKLQALDDLKKSLLHQAFSGML